MPGLQGREWVGIRGGQPDFRTCHASAEPHHGGCRRERQAIREPTRRRQVALRADPAGTLSTPRRPPACLPYRNKSGAWLRSYWMATSGRSPSSAPYFGMAVIEYSVTSKVSGTPPVLQISKPKLSWENVASADST